MTDTASAIDARLREAVGDDDDFIAELMETFVGTTHDGIIKLFDAVLYDASRDEVRREAHALRGACLTVGASAIAATCHSVETSAFAASREELGALIKEIATRLEALHGSIVATLANRAA
jgi:two-component system, sensor histidine kinase and response regulator